MKTRIFEYKGFLGINASVGDYKESGLLAYPFEHEAGFVYNSTMCEFQPAAIELLKQIPKSEDKMFSVIDVFNTNVQEEENGPEVKVVAFSFKGEHPKMILKPGDMKEGSKDYSPELLTSTEFETPAQFIEFVDNYILHGEEEVEEPINE